MIFIMKLMKECLMEKYMWNWKLNDKKGIYVYVIVISNLIKIVVYNEWWV